MREPKGEYIAGEEKRKALSFRHLAFIDAYCKSFSATGAYLVAYPNAKRTTAGANGHELLKNTEIQNEIKRRFEESHLSANEALQIIADHARGDMGDFLAIGPMGFSLDLENAREKGLTHLIKKVKQRTTINLSKDGQESETHDIEIELYDAQAAVDKALRVAGKYKDNSPVGSFDLSNMTNHQLERLANGDDIYTVLADTSAG